MPRFVFLASLLAFLSLAPAAPAQDSCAGGLVFAAQHPVGPFDSYATLNDGTRVAFDGTSIDHVDASGALILHLGDFPGFVFPAFVLPSPDNSFALVAESSNGAIVRVELNGAPQSPVATIAYSFDATWEDATHVLVSADASASFANQIVRLDIVSGATSVVAQLGGASGPIARRASSGEVFIGLVDVATPNNDSILRYSAAQISGGTLLTPADGVTFAGSLVNVAALRIDERYDASLGFWRMLVAISPFGQPSTIAQFAPNGTRLADLVASPDSISNLELFSGATPGSFAPYQPDGGETLHYRSTFYCFPSCSTSTIHELHPQRPLASIRGPGLGNPSGGSVTISLSRCAPNANALIAVGPQGLYSPTESTYVHPDGFLWHTGLALNPLRRLVTVPTDANGDASFTYFNNGSLNGVHAIQALVRDTGGLFVGSSTSVLN